MAGLAPTFQQVGIIPEQDLNIEQKEENDTSKLFMGLDY